jgi:diaminopimelate decarboxylase
LHGDGAGYTFAIVPSPFTYFDGTLATAGVSVADLADEYGTPLYVYCRPSISERISAVREAFSEYPTRLCYSVKANSNLRLLEWLAGYDLGFDVVSAGELARARSVGISPRQIVFAGVGKTREEIVAGVEAGLWMINIESVDEARVLAEVAGGSVRDEVCVSLRVNPDVDAHTHRHITTGREADKFGIALDEYGELLDWMAGRSEMRLVGLHMHIGSQITRTDPYQRGMDVILECAEMARAAGFSIEWINAGGGFGISYDGAPVPMAEEYAAALIPAVRTLGAGLVLELGRYLVGSAGCLVTEVLARKKRGGRSVVIVDAGMTDLLRPALYETPHRIVPAVEADAAETRLTDIAGPICESTDFLGRGVSLPPLNRGDRLAVLDAGAYGMSMASHYNTHTRPAEVWITEAGEVEVIRRRETFDDLLSVELEATRESRRSTGP